MEKWWVKLSHRTTRTSTLDLEPENGTQNVSSVPSTQDVHFDTPQKCRSWVPGSDERIRVPFLVSKSKDDVLVVSCESFTHQFPVFLEFETEKWSCDHRTFQ